MTIDQIEQAAQEFKFRGGVKMWAARMWVERKTPRIALLHFQIFVPQDPEGTGEPQSLRTSVALVEDDTAGEHSLTKVSPQTSPHKWIMKHWVEFMLHEIYESAMVWGQRMFDPHDFDKWHPGSL